MRTNPDRACGHYDAQFGCAPCVAHVRSQGMFPLQSSHDRKTKAGPASIPWEIADKAWAEYSRQYGRSQSVERLAQRGGFSWCEMDTLYPAWRVEVDELAQLRARVAGMDASTNDLMAKIVSLKQERDAALTRAELAEAERSVAIAALAQFLKKEQSHA